MKISQPININLSSYPVMTKSGNKKLMLEATITLTSSRTRISISNRPSVRANIRLLSLKLIIKVFESIQSMNNTTINIHTGETPYTCEYIATILQNISVWASNRFIDKCNDICEGFDYELRDKAKLEKLFSLLSGYTITLHHKGYTETIKYDNTTE